MSRGEDGALMAVVQLALVLIYTCILLIKSCQSSPVTCSEYGFGDANGAHSSLLPSTLSFMNHFHLPRCIPLLHLLWSCVACVAANYCDRKVVRC